MTTVNYVNFGGIKPSISAQSVSASSIAEMALSLFTVMANSAAATKSAVSDEVKSTTGLASATSKLTVTQGVCSSKIGAILELVKSGQVDIEQFQSLIEMVVSEIGQNNEDAGAINEQIEALNKENKEIMNEICELNNDSNHLVNIKMGKQEGDVQFDENNTNVETSNNPNAQRINELVEKYNKNCGMIEGLKQILIEISNKQAEQVSLSDQLKEEASNTLMDLNNKMNEFGQSVSEESSSAISSVSTEGVVGQTTTGNVASGNAITDAEAAAELAASTAIPVVGQVLAPKNGPAIAELTTAAATETATKAGTVVKSALIKATAATIGSGLNELLMNLYTEGLNSLAQSTDDVRGIDVQSAVDQSKFDILQQKSDKGEGLA